MPITQRKSPSRKTRPVRFTERVVYQATPEHVEALTALADRNGRTVSQEIRFALERHLADAGAE